MCRIFQPTYFWNSQTIPRDAEASFQDMCRSEVQCWPCQICTLPLSGYSFVCNNLMQMLGFNEELLGVNNFLMILTFDSIGGKNFSCTLTVLALLEQTYICPTWTYICPGHMYVYVYYPPWTYQFLIALKKKVSGFFGWNPSYRVGIDPPFCRNWIWRLPSNRFGGHTISRFWL